MRLLTPVVVVSSGLFFLCVSLPFKIQFDE